MKEFKKHVINSFICPYRITNMYLDYIIQNMHVNTLENIFSFCFRDLSQTDMSSVDMQKLLKCSFSKDTIFPSYINAHNVLDLAKNIGFGFENLNVDTSKIKIAVIDQDFKKKNKRFARNVILQKEDYSQTESFYSNAIVSTIARILPNARIYYWNSIDTYEGRFSALSDIYYYNLDRLPEDRITCVSISSKLYNFEYDEIDSKKKQILESMVKKLEEQGCYVIDTDALINNNLYISSPVYSEDLTSVIAYEPGEDWDNYNTHLDEKYDILIPGGGKLYAYPDEKDAYYYCGTVTYAYAVPYITAMFAICKDKMQNLTLKEFMSVAHNTYTTNHLGYKEINILNIYIYLYNLKK